jgi:hypothetical protein
MPRKIKNGTPIPMQMAAMSNPGSLRPARPAAMASVATRTPPSAIAATTAATVLPDMIFLQRKYLGIKIDLGYRCGDNGVAFTRLPAAAIKLPA